MTTTTSARRRAAALVAGGTAVAALALGACGAAAHTAATARPAAAPSPAAATSSAPTTSTVSTAPAAAAPVQRVAVPAGSAHTAPATVPAAVSPWDEVGRGWSAAVYTTHPGTDEGRSPAGPYTVALVSPSGKRWTVGTSSSLVTLDDVTPDGAYVLGRRHAGQNSEIVELDTHAHTWRDVTSGGGVGQIQYTQPAGRQILLSETTGQAVSSPQRLVRLDRSGSRSLDVTYAVPSPTLVVPTADGTLLVTGAPGGRIDVRDNATGAVVRTAPSPSGYHDCLPDRLWSGSQVTAWCQLDASSGEVGDVLLLDAATGRWSAVTHADVADRGSMGYDAAWPTTAGTLAMETSGCGPGATGLLDRAGRVERQLSWPGAETPAIVGVTGAAVVAQYSSCGTGPDHLVTQDLLTHTTTTLLSAPWVDAVVVDGR